MIIEVKRLWKKDKYTIGKLYVDGEYLCDTLEDKDRGLRQSMLKGEIIRLKIPNETAIPSGTYKVRLDTYSPRFGAMPFYQQTCNGKLPRLVDVPGYDGVLIHVGATAANTSGCILVGRNTAVGMLTDGKEAFTKLMDRLRGQTDVSVKVG